MKPEEFKLTKWSVRRTAGSWVITAIAFAAAGLDFMTGFCSAYAIACAAMAEFGPCED